MSVLFDPWDDAQALAERLHTLHCTLVIVLGAESWCEKCRLLRPEFDATVALANAAAANGDACEQVWLWLDLEDHCEFLGDYLPENLPMLIVYASNQLVFAQAIEPTGQALAELLSGRAGLQRMSASAALSTQHDPGLLGRLKQQDWAS
jgi:hypothetical protein